MNDIIWVTMRRLRTPLIVLILVYFISVSLMVAVPGVDDQGHAVRMGYLDAAYFVAILSTTIGFGEIPFPFTGTQRLVVFLLIFPNVVAWLYAIGAILGLFLDPDFRTMLERNRFTRRVGWMREPFFLICGFGNAGRMLGIGLLRRGFQIVALDRDETLIRSRRLEPHLDQVPMLAHPASDRRMLEFAGLDNPWCQGVIAVTSNDKVNLTVAITSKLLRPDLKVFARSQQQDVSTNMASFGTDQVVDPYEIFARRLYLALTSPARYLVQDWLLSVPGTTLRKAVKLPTGRWVVCGMGRFGSRMVEALERAGQSWTAVDSDAGLLDGLEGTVTGRGTEADTLEEAGVKEAVGLIAGTDSDVDNLSIVLTARELNPALFVVARQEETVNDALFDAEKLNADLVARPSWIVARRMLALATTPLLKTFLDHLEREKEDFAHRLKHQLEDILGGVAPSVWLTDLTQEPLYSLRAANEENVTLRLEHLVHNTRSGEDEHLRCVCLVHERGGRRLFLPSDEQDIREGDRLLFAGRGSARREIDRALADPVLLMDFATPYRVPRTAIGRWWARRTREPVSRA